MNCENELKNSNEVRCDMRKIAWIIPFLLGVLFAAHANAAEYEYDPIDFAIQETPPQKTWGLATYVDAAENEKFYAPSEHPGYNKIWGLTKAEWGGELAFQALNVVDFALTDRILDDGGYEMNFCLPIDGDSSDLEMGLVTVGIGLAHYLVTRYVIEPEWRPTWQWWSGGAKAIVVGHNFTVVEW